MGDESPGTDAGRRRFRDAGRAWWFAVLRTERDRRLAEAAGRPIIGRNLGRLLARRMVEVERRGSGPVGSGAHFMVAGTQTAADAGREGAIQRAVPIKTNAGPEAGKEHVMGENPNAVPSLDFAKLRAAVESGAALRCRRALHPVGGAGDKVFPPTYAGAVYAVEQRRVRDAEGAWSTVTCVLLDSVQSQANRMEEALQEAIDDGSIRMPLVVVDFSDAKLLEPIGRVTSLQAPHRIADAILRDSEYEKKPFRASAVGAEIDRASTAFATPLFRLCPQALVFGMWDSTGPKGGLGTKFERAVVSEVVGVNVEFGTKSSSRIDPLQISKGAGPVFVKKNSGGREWTLDPAEAELKEKKPVPFGGNKDASKRGNPAAINHGNVVPSLSDLDRSGQPLSGGITCDYAEQTTTLSLIALRRLRFPIDEKSQAKADANAAARAVLAALGLASAVLAFGPGMDLRSRCVLFPETPMEWELLDTPGAQPKRFVLDRAAALALIADAVAAARKAGLPWDVDPIVLTPSKQLVELVRKSQELAVSDADAE